MAETVTEERAETWQTEGIRTHSTRIQWRITRGPQEDETGDDDRTAPTEMYLPDLDNTPLSQALKNGLDWGMEDEVMVECPKLKQYFGVDTFLIQRISG